MNDKNLNNEGCQIDLSNVSKDEDSEINSDEENEEFRFCPAFRFKIK